MTAAPDPFPRTPARPRLPHPATSVYTDVFRDNAFDADSAGPASLSVDAGAFLVANRLGIGAYLQGTGAWTVSVAGAVVSTYGEGLFVDPGRGRLADYRIRRGQRKRQDRQIAASGAVIENAGTVVGKSTDVDFRRVSAHSPLIRLGGTSYRRVDLLRSGLIDRLADRFPTAQHAQHRKPESSAAQRRDFVARVEHMGREPNGAGDGAHAVAGRDRRRSVALGRAAST